MSVRFVVAAVVGAVVGYYSGSAQAGFAAFSLVYGVTAGLDPNAKQTGPRLDDLKGPTAAEGSAIPYIEGVWRTAGSYVWNSDKQEVSTTTTTDGKGGPGVDSTTFSYKIDVLVLVSINQLIALRRVFSLGRLVWSNADDADDQTLLASDDTVYWDEIRFYDGNPDQLPDPDYEAAVGAGNAPANRGRSTIFIKGLNLGSSGQMPVLTFEVTSSGTIATSFIPTQFYVMASPRASTIVPTAPYCGPSHTLYVPNWDDSRDNSSFLAFAWNGSTKAFDETVGGGDLDHSLYGSTGFVTGTSDENYFVVRGLGGSDLFRGDEVASDSRGASYNKQFSDAVSWFARYDGSTFFGIDLSGFYQGADTPHMIGDPPAPIGWRLALSDNSDQWIEPVDTTSTHYVPTGATRYVGKWYVPRDISAGLGESLIYRYRIDVDPTTHLTMIVPDGTITDPRASSGINGTLMTDVVTGKMYMHQFRTIWEWQPGSSTWSLYQAFDGAAQVDSNDQANETMYDGSLFLLADLGGNAVAFRTAAAAQRVTLVPVPLDQLVQRLCLRTGLLTADDLDVTALAADTVRGIALSSGTTRQAIETLMPAKTFEAVEGEKLKFVKRGGAPVLTIPFADLGASADGDSSVDPLPTTRANDIELPAKVFVKFSNAFNDYQDGLVSGDRLVTQSTSTTSVELPIVLTPKEAQRVADVQTMDLQVSIDAIGPLILTRAYAALEPTDVVLVEAKDGSHFRCRIQKITDSNGTRTLELVIDQASVVTSVASGDEADYSTVLVRGVLGTEAVLLDIPILRDGDDDSGFYEAVKPGGGAGKWTGTVIKSSRDDVTYADETSITSKAVFGKCSTALGDWTGARMFDERNSVTVDVGAGELFSSTRDAMLNDQTINAFAIGVDGRWELGQFRDAVLQSAGVYKLTGFLRGSRGTEWAMTGHTDTDAFVLLQPTGVARISVDTSLLGVTRYYRAVSIGKSVTTATANLLNDTGVGLKPFSPFDVRASRSPASSDITLTWQRRTRLTTRATGLMGISVPLGESAELYSIDVFSDGTYTTVKRTISTTSASAVYTSAQQVSDFGSNQAKVYVKVYQLSAAVGRGTPVKAAA